MLYCRECREPGRFPWQHDPECVEGLKHKVSAYQTAMGWILLLLFAETVLLVIAFMMLARHV